MKLNLAVTTALATLAIALHVVRANATVTSLESWQPGVNLISEAFGTYPLVAFSEPGHGVPGTKEFFWSLLRVPGFAGTVNDLVIECGNARYQSIADRYFSGGVVGRSELRQIWENTTVASGVWDVPMFEEILADIRTFNLTLGPDRRIRVLLGDPPIDWSRVRGPADEDMNDWRDAHFAWVIDQQVMRKHRKALLWIGGAHTSRKVVLPDSLIHLLDQRFPGKTFVVHAVDRDQVSASVASRLGAWPASSAVPVRDTWLGLADVREVGHGLSRGIVQDDLDALLFWEGGKPSAAARDSLDPARLEELRRRQRLAEATLPFRGARIRFEVGRPEMTTQSESALSEVLSVLRRDGRLTLLVKAFADGRERDGLSLSAERARRVVSWLTARGIEPTRLVPKGCGAVRALWIGDTEEERAANRRAELVRNSAAEDCTPPSSFNWH